MLIYDSASLKVSAQSTAGELAWFAIQVKCRYEERVAATLLDKGYDSLSATVRALRRKEKGPTLATRALFPGYIFSRFDVRLRMPILVTPGVQAIVGYGRTPVPVDDKEILSIRQVLESGERAEACDFVSVGDLVEVSDGPLKGTQGILVQQRSSSRVVVSVSLIQRSIRVEVSLSLLKRIQPRSMPLLSDDYQANWRTQSIA